MNLKPLITLPIAALCCAMPAYADEHGAKPRITDIQARLVYEKSGTLSEDITDNDQFVARNVIIGEGSAQENANDLIVMAVIDADEEVFTEAALLITVRDGENEVLQQRVIDGILLEQQTHRAILLEDIGCAGTLILEAKLGYSVKTETLTLDCGE